MSENEKTYFYWNKRAFEDSVRELVCPKCPYVGSHPRECKNPDPQGCALFRYLPELVRVAQRMDNPNLPDYTELVKKQVSFRCEKPPLSRDTCNLLDSPRCGLDRLLPYVLEAVQKTDQALETRKEEVQNGCH